ncbi:hypothetical protein [Mesorhizobium sp. RIZ17]|uniref:hypothetical protein n=1 Tax=Mesorhizobium sp. RIZ17 TaxID=3132743 RepID=UPI003DA9944A
MRAAHGGHAALWLIDVSSPFMLHEKKGTRAVAREADHMDRGLFFVIGDFFNTFGSAAAAARALEAGRKPRRSDLKKPGIDPAAFDRIGRF